MVDVIIGPRLWPSLRVADAFLGVNPTGKATGFAERPVWQWAVDLPNSLSWEGDDLAGRGDAEEMLLSLCSFLMAAGLSEFHRHDAIHYGIGVAADNVEEEGE